MGRGDKRVRLRQRHHFPLAPEPFNAEASRISGRYDDAEINHVIVQRTKKGGRRHLAERQLDSREGRVDTDKGGGELGSYRLLAQTQTQPPGTTTGDCPGTTRGVFQLAQDSTCLRNKFLAGPRQTDQSSLVTDQDIKPEFGFDGCNLSRQRRLRDPEPLGRTVEVQLFRRHQQVSEPKKFHGSGIQD